MLKIAFQSFYISKFSAACSQTPLAARAFGARTFLPRLGLKSGYGPGYGLLLRCYDIVL